PKHRFLHLATHGFFADESATSALDTEARARAGRAGLELDRAVAGVHPGLLSGLVFAGANADPAGGLLTALEAGDLDLRGAELAVLSACHTGEGGRRGGGARAPAGLPGRRRPDRGRQPVGRRRRRPAADEPVLRPAVGPQEPAREGRGAAPGPAGDAQRGSAPQRRAAAAGRPGPAVLLGRLRPLRRLALTGRLTTAPPGRPA